VRGGTGGRGTPFSYSATAKGRRSVEEARRQLTDDAELIRRGKEDANDAEEPLPQQQQEQQQAGQEAEGSG
jgi:DNA-binding PadR family transcriptional regulator